jgi:SAM-dependent methyltransferase
MPFSEEWEKDTYSKGKQINSYPFSDLISLVMRFAKQTINCSSRILELGCGTGPNIQFFLDNEFKYFGIEGASSAVRYIEEKFGQQVSVKADDFTKAIPYQDEYFDLMVDRSAVTHNTMQEIEKVINECHRVLKNDCLMIITDWFSKMHSDAANIDAGESDIEGKLQSGQFKDVGVVHFFSEQEIKKLFSKKWEIIYLCHKIKDKIIPAGGSRKSAVFDIVAKKIAI